MSQTFCHDHHSIPTEFSTFQNTGFVYEHKDGDQEIKVVTSNRGSFRGGDVQFNHTSNTTGFKARSSINPMKTREDKYRFKPLNNDFDIPDVS